MRLRTRPSPVWDKFGERAHAMYVVQMISTKRIAELLGIKASTVENWTSRFGWSRERAMNRKGPQAHLETIAETVNSLVEALREKLKSKQLPTAAEADVLTKFVAILERLSGDVYFPGHMVRTQNLLCEYLRVSGKDELLNGLIECLSGFSVWAMAGK